MTKQPFFYRENGTRVLKLLAKPGSKQGAMGNPKAHQPKISVTAGPPAGADNGSMARFRAADRGMFRLVIELAFGRMNVSKRLPAVTAQEVG